METYVEPVKVHCKTEKNASQSKLDPIESDNNNGWLECNICLDTIYDPVVTLCGHLYCWPCIYEWLNFQSNPDTPKRCPVCKASISESTLVPLYGRANAENKTKRLSYGPDIPGRPPASPNVPHHSPRHIPGPRQFHRIAPSSQQPIFSVGGTLATSPTTLCPSNGMFGEMVYARVFGNPSATSLYLYPNSYHHLGTMTPRLRRQHMQAEKSLYRVSIFLICFTVLCFILF